MLSRVIEVDPQKCVNCHACIAACPVKYCNNGTADHVEVDPDLCIACGSCIAACTHGARRGVDDFPRALEALGSGQRMIAISAPAIASNFPESYLRVQGWLQSLGVRDFFDVSFGAELTIKSYADYLKNAGPSTVIAQPCPAVVSYIELYQPELLPYLAPADSPMLHTIKMIREYYPVYSGYKILVLSPCYAKRREFDETGLGDYNVTFKSLADHIKAEGIDLRSYPEIDFVGDAAERAARR
jgi:iron only hydrogenase large subunit-like protein